MKKTKKRKSIKEIRLQERLRGFEECYEIFTDAWRNAQRIGIYDNPVQLWPVIEKAEKVLSELDKSYKVEQWPRVYGKPFDL